MTMTHAIRPILFGILLGAFALPVGAKDLMQIPAKAAQEGFKLSDQLIFPAFDPALGRKLFGDKGCVVCHQVNGIGGEDGPNLSYGQYDTPVNAMEVASDLWEKASIMIPAQEDELGAQIKLSPDELAGIIAFLADPAEQKHFKKSDIPAKILKDMENM